MTTILKHCLAETDALLAMEARAKKAEDQRDEMLRAAKALLRSGDFLTLVPKEGKSTLACIQSREQLEAAIARAEGRKP